MSLCNPRLPEALSSLTLCVTGYSGFVGSHLMAALNGANIRPCLIPRPGITKLSGNEGEGRLLAWNTPEELAVHLASLETPVVLNIAGYFVSRHTPLDIAPLVSGNLEFPIQVFEALKASGHGRIVNIGTSWEYTDSGQEEPANLYAQIKAANAKTLEWYARHAPFQGINLKLNDTYGGKDARAKLMPLIKKNWVEGRPASLRSWAQPVNLLHITDVIEGLLAAALHTGNMAMNTTETVFLLARETIKLGTLTDLLRGKIAEGLEVIYEDVASENPKLRGVWDDAPRQPNWNPRIEIAEGMADFFRMDP